MLNQGYLLGMQTTLLWLGQSVHTRKKLLLGSLLYIPGVLLGVVGWSMVFLQLDSMVAIIMKP